MRLRSPLYAAAYTTPYHGPRFVSPLTVTFTGCPFYPLACIASLSISIFYFYFLYLFICFWRESASSIIMSIIRTTPAAAVAAAIHSCHIYPWNYVNSSYSSRYCYIIYVLVGISVYNNDDDNTICCGISIHYRVARKSNR